MSEKDVGNSKSSKEPQPGTSKSDSTPGTSNNSHTADQSLQKLAHMLQFEDDVGFPVIPKKDCPHVTGIKQDFTNLNINAECVKCKSNEENWICLICDSIFCSRYINGHMKEHNEKTQHAIALSFSDISVWCYNCDDYIENELLFPVKNVIHTEKFGYSLPSYSINMAE